MRRTRTSFRLPWSKRDIMTRDMQTVTVVRGREALHQMIATRRPAGSRSERTWIDQWLTPLGCKPDRFGNLWLQIGEAPRVLWSSHTDTVHSQGGQQRLATDAEGRLFVHPTERQSTCLGADDTAGVWLMREMILAGKPGLYIFHREEEIGGHGSAFIARHAGDHLKGIDFAIALDRRGYSSVITHQGGRCCSDAFALALADQLGDAFCPDDSGTFTDTANYTGQIPECTNLSVGYFNAHRATEWLDVPFLEGLLGKLLALDVDALPVKRDPQEDEWSDWDLPDTQFADTMTDLVSDHPEAVASFLESWGIDEDELRTLIRRHEDAEDGLTDDGGVPWQ